MVGFLKANFTIGHEITDFDKIFDGEFKYRRLPKAF